MIEATDTSEPTGLSARQWDALGQLRRLEDQGLTAARQPGGMHLATLKSLQALGLVVIADHPGRDRKGRRWLAHFTEAGRLATGNTPAPAPSAP
ncbi:hypothetical protein ABIA33_007446 [Streptacidiphilus sp. MAP12-16]|uniref:hypothetical protein n=1 Tax=Streptacidiphilus sp. MAP12-16 TaxID=3156300 RepID=UPI003511A75D